MNEYGYPGFGTVAEAEYGDEELKGHPGLYHPDSDTLQRGESGSLNAGEVEKGRAL